MAMSGYICGQCRSNSCSHVDPGLQKQMIDRYMKEQIFRNGLGMNASDLSPILRGTENMITFSDGVQQSSKKLLLLRRKPC